MRVFWKFAKMWFPTQKNYLAVHFKLDYVKADGNISNYYPDFFVKLTDKRIVIVETKGQENLDVPLKDRAP